jgi:ABC-2 type transport system ATP-binding protein
MVRLEGIGKRFPLRRSWAKSIFAPGQGEYQLALQDVHLEVGRGEFFGLLGQNGAGKTTLFKILATLVLPDSGRAQVAGFDVEREGAGVRGVLTPVIPNERSLYWRISAFENLRLYASLHGIWGAEAFRRTTDLLELVGLADAGEKQVGLFSSGMKQRLLIARALVSRPKVLLLDEPTRSLDPVTARDLRRFLREEIVGRQGCTVLLATHDQAEVSELCDRVGILERGKLLAVGATVDLVRRLQIHRYRVWTRQPDHAVFASLGSRGAGMSAERHRTDADGWTRIDLEIPEGADEAARVLARLTAEGVTVSRFERVELPLAELIERVGGEPPQTEVPRS